MSRQQNIRVFKHVSIAVLSVSIVVMGAVPATAQLRVVTWNTATTGSTFFETRQTHFNQVLDFIGREEVNGIARDIDVLILQEQEQDSSTLTQFANELNTITGTSDYVAWSETPFNSDGYQVGFVYNSATMGSQFEDWYRTDLTRSTGRLSLRPTGYGEDSDLWLYNTHYKAGTTVSDETRRRDTAIKVRWEFREGKQGSGSGVDSGLMFGSDYLDETANAIYAGDFNQKDSYDDAGNSYPTLTENPYEIMKAGTAPWTQDPPTTGYGQGVDPIDKPGSWYNNYSFREIHTQSPHDGTYGLVTGGMDDRFDMQLMSTELNDGEGLSYIGPNAGNSTAAEESYHTFGNNGTTFNAYANSTSNTGLDWIISQGETLPGMTSTQTRDAVRDALAKASDHSPVVVDLQLPAAMGVQVGSFESRMIVGATATVDVIVSNNANVLVAVAADELDYSGNGSGDLGGSFSGTDQATGGGNAHILTLDTSSAGAASGSVVVNSTSKAVANGSFSQAVNYDVLDHSEGSFEAGTDRDALTIDFGTIRQGRAGADRPFSIYSLEQTAGYTAGLDLDAIHSSGDTSRLAADLAIFSNLAAGGSNSYQASLDTTANGTFSSVYTLSVSDENTLGAATGSDLTLTLDAEVTLLGDVDKDGDLMPDDIDADDIDAAYALFGTGDMFGDLNDSAMVDQADVDMLVRDILQTEYGDADLDGLVTVIDLGSVATNFNLGTGFGWNDGDFTGDGEVNVDDLGILATCYGFGLPAVASIPEPGSMTLLLCGPVCLMLFRRRR